jgi:tRNA G46 methylase TrmB
MVRFYSKTTGSPALPVDNPARTADFLARHAALRETLAALLRDHPRITLEIGCGHGHFLAACAAAGRPGRANVPSAKRDTLSLARPKRR